MITWTFNTDNSRWLAFQHGAILGWVKAVVNSEDELTGFQAEQSPSSKQHREFPLRKKSGKAKKDFEKWSEENT